MSFVSRLSTFEAGGNQFRDKARFVGVGAGNLGLPVFAACSMCARGSKNFFDVRLRRADFESAHRENNCRGNYDSCERARRLEAFCRGLMKNRHADGGSKKEGRYGAQDRRAKR